MAQQNKTKYAILGVLSMKPASGYDIKKFCDKGISHFWNENFGHIYPVLRQMENDGVVTKTAEKTDGKPIKNVYSITQKGREELIDWLIKPTESSPARLELLLKLTFAKNIPAEKIVEEMERVKQNHIQRLKQYKETEKEMNADERTKKDPGYPYWLATLRYGIYDAEFRIKWCEETINNITKYNEL